MKIITLIILIFISQWTFAEAPMGGWKCYAFDFQRQSYDGMGKTMRSAMHDARKNCLQRASNKHSCKTAQSYCEQGALSIGEDRCVAADGSGKVFNTTGPDACDVAMTICDDWQYQHGNSQQGRYCQIVHR